MANVCLPTPMVSDGTMLSVSGTLSIIRVPEPGVLSISSEPPIFSMFARTTSMPTPRPETAVTFLAVLRPGSQISALRSRMLSSVASSALRMPAAMAFSTSLSPSMPLPSSTMPMRISLPVWRAEICSRPISRLPAAWRSAGVSMP